MLSKIPADLEKLKKLGSKYVNAELIRIGIIAELDAIDLYEQLASISNDKLVKRVFLDIAREEKEHVGEFIELLKRTDREQVVALEDGSEEIKEMEE